MTEDEAYKVHIQYTFNAFCKIVIRHAAIDKILKLRRRWEREISLDYLMNEKFVQLAEPEQLEEYLFTACGQTAVLYHAELAAALALLPEQTQEEIFRYYFLRQPQRVIGVHIGRTRSTAGRHGHRGVDGGIDQAGGVLGALEPAEGEAALPHVRELFEIEALLGDLAEVEIPIRHLAKVKAAAGLAAGGKKIFFKLLRFGKLDKLLIHQIVKRNFPFPPPAQL